MSDEAACLAALAEQRRQFDAHALSDVRINVFRVIAGRATYSHLISINTPSPERLAVVLDVFATEPWAIQWTIASARFLTIVRHGTFRELTR